MKRAFKKARPDKFGAGAAHRLVEHFTVQLCVWTGDHLYPAPAQVERARLARGARTAFSADMAPRLAR